MNYLIKFLQNEKTYYLATEYKEKFGDIKLSLFREGICYSGTVYENDFENMSSVAKLEMAAFWDLSLSILISNLLEKKDLEVKHNSDPHIITFIWKKVLHNSSIKQRLGSVLLKKSGNKGDDFFDYLVILINKQQQELENLKDQQKKILKNYNESLEKLEAVSDVKADIEKQLFSKFLLVLNTKKDRIKFLKEKLEGKGPGISRDLEQRKRKGQTISDFRKKKNKYEYDSSDDSDSSSISEEDSIGKEKIKSPIGEDEISNAGTLSTADGSEDYNAQMDNVDVELAQKNENSDYDDVQSDDNDEIMIKNECLSQKIIVTKESSLKELQEILTNPIQKSDNSKEHLLLSSHEEDLDSTQEMQDTQSLKGNGESDKGSTSEALNYLDDLI